MAAQTADRRKTESFVRERMPCVPAPTLAYLRLHQANASSGLARFVEASSDPSQSPYWAWCWPGGLALAHHLHAHPGLAAGRTVLDLGSGSGLVAIAAAKAGAAAVTAVDTDPHAAAAQRLNAAANGVTLVSLCGDWLDREAFAVDLVTAGDLFYDAALAPRVLACLRRFRQKGAGILIGDPGRAFLPLGQLRHLATWRVPDVGDPPGSALRPAHVFELADVAAP